MEYRTKDLAEAAALLVSGKNLTRLDREGHICWFVFEGKSECEILSTKFFFTGLLVNARQYHEAMSRLKNRIFSI